MLDKESTKEKEYNPGTLNLKENTKQPNKEEKPKELLKKKRLEIEKEEIFTIRDFNGNVKKKQQSKDASESKELGKIENFEERRMFKSTYRYKKKVIRVGVVDIYKKKKKKLYILF